MEEKEQKNHLNPGQTFLMAITRRLYSVEEAHTASRCPPSIPKTPERIDTSKTVESLKKKSFQSLLPTGLPFSCLHISVCLYRTRQLQSFHVCQWVLLPFDPAGSDEQACLTSCKSRDTLKAHVTPLKGFLSTWQGPVSHIRPQFVPQRWQLYDSSFGSLSCFVDFGCTRASPTAHNLEP